MENIPQKHDEGQQQIETRDSYKIFVAIITQIMCNPKPKSGSHS